MRERNERGVVMPSPVIMLSVIAVAMAGIAYVATRVPQPAEREVATVSRTQPSQSPSPGSRAPSGPRPAKPVEKKPVKKKPPEVDRGAVYVEVYNNSGITGLAGSVASRAAGLGWQVVGSDNWYGTIPANTVYYPSQLQTAAHTLARDLGIARTVPAVDPMRLDRLTVILTGPLP